MSSPAEEPCPTADGVGRVEDCRWGSSGEEGEDDLSSDDEEDVVPFGLGSPMTGVTFADGAGDFDDSPATEDSDDSGEVAATPPAGLLSLLCPAPWQPRRRSESQHLQAPARCLRRAAWL